MNKSIVLACAWFMLASSARAAQMPLLHDDFDDNVIDLAKWSSWSSDAPLTIAEVNQRVEIFFPGDLVPASYALGASYGAVCQVAGDYDIQVHYKLLTWPLGSGVRVGLGVGPAVVERISEGGEDMYVTDGPASVWGHTPTTDLEGYLRASRADGLFTGYFWNGSEWVALATQPAGSDDASIAIASWTDTGRFNHQDVRIAFDDFAVTRGTMMVCGGAMIVPVQVLQTKEINPNSNDPFEVAALSSSGLFDATAIDPASVRFAGAPLNTSNNGALRHRLADIDGDGLLDFVGEFVPSQTTLTSGTTSATLTANAARAITGTGPIVVK